MAAKTPRINRFSQMIRFFRVSRLLLWTIWVIYNERRRVVRARERGNYEVRPNIEVLIKVLVAFRQTAIKLGVLMIKLGQFLSSRADLLPEQALAVLGSLQDEVPPAPFEHVVSVIESELGKPVEEIFRVLEWIDGIKINDYAALDAAGINMLEVAKRTVSTYFYQFFEAGFFHADPHPGNIFVKKGSPGEGPIIAFVDFGMVGTLTKGMKKSLKDLFLGFVSRNTKSLVDALARLGFIGEGANMAAIERAMALMMEQYYDLTLGQARELDIPNIGMDIENLLYGQPFQIPAQFAFIGRAIGTLVGVSTGLAPEFNFVEVATPYARKFLGLDAEGSGQTIQEILNQLVDTGRILLTLPRSLERVVTKLETGQIEVKLVDSQRNGRSRRRGRRRGRDRGNESNVSGMGSFSWAMLFLAEMAGGIILTIEHQPAPGWFCLGLAAVTALGLLVRR